MTLCGMKNNKGDPCSNKAANGFFVNDVAVCKTHYGNHAIELKQAEIDAISPPKEPRPPVTFTPCKCKTKEGTKEEKYCENPAKNDPLYEGMCSAHYKAHLKKLEKESQPPKEEVERIPCKQIIKDPKEGSKQCTQLEVIGCDGYCKRHYNLKHKAENPKPKTEQNELYSGNAAIQALTEAANAAITALAAAKEAAAKEEASKLENKKVKKERKPRQKKPSPETLENVVEKLEDETSDLLTRQIPFIEGVDISKPNLDNPMEDIEIPDDC